MPNQCADCNANPVDIAKNTTGTPTAKLIAILEAHGITAAATLAEIIGISERAIRKARNCGSGTQVPGGTTGPELQDLGGTTVPKTELQDRNSGSALACAGITTGATKESPTEISISNNQLASLPTDDISQLMITDIVSWMHGADRSNAEQWLSNTTKMYGSDITRQSYHKLKTDILTGSVIARKLQAWCGIAQRMQSAPPKPAADVIPFKTSPELQQTAAIFAKLKAQGASNAAG